MPTYEVGDYVKVEFPDEETGLSEWMWFRIGSCDEAKRLVFGTLENALNDYGGKLRLGSDMAIRFDRIRDRKAAEFDVKH